ncbi:hypothetical protein OHT61_01045 [Streptomyces sp. NBC_00178]|uniref:hypothetical protein n=1 Tax=Streptomyces sp. NBC_00178 TaxID=2975672 RepID=UPI002E29F059|nr:hypothetical protein [Streptomyces sp. NBC_00178]
MDLPASALRPGPAGDGPGAAMTLTLGGDHQGAGEPLVDPAGPPTDLRQATAGKAECVG